MVSIVIIMRKLIMGAALRATRSSCLQRRLLAGQVKRVADVVQRPTVLDQLNHNADAPTIADHARADAVVAVRCGTHATTDINALAQSAGRKYPRY